MTPEQFRQHGHEVVDWIADYWIADRRRCPVRSQVSPGEVRAALPAAAPEQGEPFSAVLADLDRVVLPGVTHWQHPGFFGYFPANTSGPSVLGDLVSAGLGVQGMSWVTSPAATELEQHVMDWLADLLGLPGVLPLHRHRRRRRPGLQLRRPTWSPCSPPCTGPARARRVRHGVDPDRATVYVSAGDPLVDGEGGPDRRPRHRRRPHRRGRRRPRHAPGRARRPARAGRRPRLHPGAGLRHGRDDVDDGRRPARRARPDLPEVRRLAARRRRLRRGERRRPRAARRCRPASSGPTATPPTRTSGCSPASTRRCSGSPTAPRSPARCRSSRSTCATPPPRPAPSSTTATGRSRSAAASAR